MAEEALSLVSDATPTTDKTEVLYTNEERRTMELVIGLVGPVGAGVSTTAEQLRIMLEGDYGYSVDVVKVSSFINDNCRLGGHEPVPLHDEERVYKLQAIGSSLREKFGEGILADFCIRHIHQGRDIDDEAARIRRHCTIIDSLKHPKEVERLRLVYGDLFWLVGVFAPEDVRADRLQSLNPDNAYIKKINDQDYDEGVGHGQSVKDTMSLADMFIRNDEQNTVKLSKALETFLGRVFQVSVSTPDSHETAMFAASSAALRSACLSRQVGAVIQNSHGEIIGQGANDVPKYEGGLYSSDLSPELDHRCYGWGKKVCHNDTEKAGIYLQIEKIFESVIPGATFEQIEKFSKELRNSKIKGLIEFSRAVHAEMAAIVSVARDGKGEVKGATLYSTTFPCHNCARHIVAAGITTVFYIEPYPKSLALKLHSDAIATRDADKGKKVLFLQYQGTAPRSFTRMFPQNPLRKAGSKAFTLTKTEAVPYAAAPVDSLVTREQLELAKILREIEGVEKQAGASTSASSAD